jgi:hypothetical protein
VIVALCNPRDRSLVTISALIASGQASAIGHSLILSGSGPDSPKAQQ